MVTSLWRVCVRAVCMRASDCVNKKTKINLPKQHIPWQYTGHLLLFLFFDTFLWVSFSVKKPCCLQYTMSSHSCRWTCLCFWTISYAIVCHHGYHTDQKHANRRIVVTGLESGGNIQLFTVCFSLNECASALIFKTIIYSKMWICQISTVKVPCYGIRNLISKQTFS